MAIAEGASLFHRIIKPDDGGLSRELAAYVLSLDFDQSDKVRFDELSEKARRGTLTPEDEREIDNFLNVDAFISLLRLKADRVLKGRQ